MKTTILLSAILLSFYTNAIGSNIEIDKISCGGEGTVYTQKGTRDDIFNYDIIKKEGVDMVGISFGVKKGSCEQQPNAFELHTIDTEGEHTFIMNDQDGHGFSDQLRSEEYGEYSSFLSYDTNRIKLNTTHQDFIIKTFNSDGDEVWRLVGKQPHLKISLEDTNEDGTNDTLVLTNQHLQTITVEEIQIGKYLTASGNATNIKILPGEYHKIKITADERLFSKHKEDLCNNCNSVEISYRADNSILGLINCTVTFKTDFAITEDDDQSPGYSSYLLSDGAILVYTLTGLAGWQLIPKMIGGESKVSLTDDKKGVDTGTAQKEQPGKTDDAATKTSCNEESNEDDEEGESENDDDEEDEDDDGGEEHTNGVKRMLENPTLQKNNTAKNTNTLTRSTIITRNEYTNLYIDFLETNNDALITKNDHLNTIVTTALEANHTETSTPTQNEGPPLNRALFTDAGTKNIAGSK